MKPLIEVRHVKKFFPVYTGFFRRVSAYVKAVDNVSLKLDKGETLGIVGESGSGKTTLGRMIAGLVQPTGGEILAQKGVQMVFQDPGAALNPRHTVSQALTEPLIYHKLVSSFEEAEKKALHILEEIGLDDSALNKYPHAFSLGQKQRIAIGRALMMQPGVIVCDEPVSALDLSVQAQILNLLNKLKHQFHLSYLFISHDLNVIRHISDRVIVMYLGQVMEEGRTEDIFSHPKHPYTQALLGATPGSSYPKLSLKGEIPSSVNPPGGCPFHTRCPFAEPICHEKPPLRSGEGEDHHYSCILP